jgi:DNA polymerase II small subunit
METKKEILKICMSKGFLLDKEILEILSNLKEAEEVISFLENLDIKKGVITKTFFSKNLERIRTFLIGGKNKTVIEKFFINLGYSKKELEGDLREKKSKEEKFAKAEKMGAEREEEISINYLKQKTSQKTQEQGVVKVLSPLVHPAKKVSVEDFINHFKLRYDELKKVLEAKGLEGLTSIRRISEKKSNYTIIASVLRKRITKNKNILLEVEDPSGKIVVLVNQNRKEVFEKAKDLLLDDIVAFNVSGNSDILFANDIVFPDISLAEKKKHNKDEIVAFVSDFHVGSSMFLEEEFMKFIKWINGQEGSEEQKKLANKIKYLFIVGDCVDGVGVFPTQERHLKIKDIKSQYIKLAELLNLIRKDIKMIISPGQHDAVWVGEPQPVIGGAWAPDLYKMDNVVLVTNPALVEIDGGFRILMYHGASMIFFIEGIEELRLKYGQDSPVMVAKEMLKRRHLAPIHGSVDYVPGGKQDSLLISTAPDIFLTGNQHRAEVSSYNNILLIASSCWQDKTPFEEKVGHHPEPCKVPLFNLKTREIKILDFSNSTEGGEK